MRYEFDFLPESYRRERVRRQARRQSAMLLALVACGMLVTEGVLRQRLGDLRATRSSARRQAEFVATRASRTKDLLQRHTALLADLEEWCRPFQYGGATEVLDGVLTALPEGMLLQQLDWRGGDFLGGDPRATLRIAGVVPGLEDVVAFLGALESVEGVPRLEVRQTGVANGGAAGSLQTFLVESPVSGGTP